MGKKEDEKVDSMKTVRCPVCKNKFDLAYDGEILRIDSCLSGGVYGVQIVCPNCNNSEDIY